jgi:hypothetical protein
MAEPSTTPSLGVLFVHGIGNQKQGQTLATWGDAVARWLAVTDAPSGTVEVRPVLMHPGDSTTPANGHLTTPEGERWLLAEAWWGDEHAPPSYREVAIWSLKVVPTALLHHLVAALRRGAHARAAGGHHKLRPLLAALVLSITVAPFILLLTPVVAVGVLTLLIVGLLPISGVRDWVHKAQRLLSGTVGDSLVLLNSPFQAGAMQTKVQLGIDFLRQQRCSRIAVVAHSQGAAVAAAALQNPTHADVSVLITCGSGINKLEELRRRRNDWLPAWLPSVAFWVAAFIVTWLIDRIRSEELGAIDLLASMSVIILAASLLAFAASWIENKFDADWVAHIGSFAGPVIVALVTTGVIPTTSLLGLAVLAIGWIGWEFLHATSRSESPPIEVVPSVPLWFDLYASRDPVPDGPTRTEVHDYPVAFEVENVHSVVRDHNRYVTSQDGALALALFILQDVDRRGVVNLRRITSAFSELDAERKRRVWMLRSTRYAILFSALIAISVNFSDAWPTATWLQEHLERAWATAPSIDSIDARIVASSLILAIWGFFYAAVLGAWSVWDSSASERALRQVKAGRALPGSDSGLIAWCLVWAALLTLALRSKQIALAIVSGPRGVWEGFDQSGPWLLGTGAVALLLHYVLSRANLFNRSAVSRQSTVV